MTPQLLAIGVVIASFIIILLAFVAVTLHKKDKILGFGTHRFRKITYATIFGFIGLSLFLSLVTFDFNKQKSIADTESTLHTVLLTTFEGLNLWISNKQDYLREVGRNKELVTLTKQLIKQPPHKETLLSNPLLENIRSFFHTRKDTFGET